MKVRNGRSRYRNRHKKEMTRKSGASMGKNRVVRKVFDNKPEGRRNVGRPSLSCLENRKKYSRKLKVKS